MMLNVHDCPFMDCLVSMCVFHLSGRISPLDPTKVAVATMSFLLALLQENDLEKLARMFLQIGIGKLVFEADFRSQFSDPKLYKGGNYYYDIFSHNSFD